VPNDKHEALREAYRRAADAQNAGATQAAMPAPDIAQTQSPQLTAEQQRRLTELGTSGGLVGQEALVNEMRKIHRTHDAQREPHAAPQAEQAATREQTVETVAHRHSRDRANQDREIRAIAMEHAQVLAQQAEQMQTAGLRPDGFGGELKQSGADAERDSGIRSAFERYQTALRQNFSEHSPYLSLSLVPASEYAAFIHDQKDLTHKINREHDLEARRVLELHKEIEAADHVASTSRRIADQSELISGMKDNAEVVKFRERAADFEAASKALQEEHREQLQSRTEWTHENATGRQSDQAQSGRGEDQNASHYAQTARDSLVASGITEKDGGEISDAKAERLGKLVENQQQTATQAAKQTQPTKGRGGIE
jgi:hypothetical protein